jgi:hypothetical protein
MMVFVFSSSNLILALFCTIFDEKRDCTLL